MHHMTHIRNNPKLYLWVELGQTPTDIAKFGVLLSTDEFGRYSEMREPLPEGWQRPCAVGKKRVRHFVRIMLESSRKQFLKTRMRPKLPK